tara:strand:+ start:96390 stop:98705 length:2316 start_codon:yes stop_codon:yes gene_type:complete
MIPENINPGTPNQKDGDKLRDAFVKVNTIFTDIYTKLFTKTSELTNDGADGINPFITAADVPTVTLGDRGQIIPIDVAGETSYGLRGVNRALNHIAIGPDTMDLTKRFSLTQVGLGGQSGFAFGYDLFAAAGHYGPTMFGYNNRILGGNYGTIFGQDNVMNSGYSCFVTGVNNIISSPLGYTFTTGRNNLEAGRYSATLGVGLVNRGYGTVIGTANLDNKGTTSSTSSNNPLLIVGNGSLTSNASNTALVRSDAFLVYQNGRVIAPSLTPALIDTNIKSLVTKEYTDTVSNKILHTTSTGLSQGGVVSVNTDTTKFDITAGFGYIVDGHTNVEIPTSTKVTFTEKLAVTPQFLATHNASYIAIDISGNVFQTSTPLTATQRRNYIRLGLLVHPDNTAIFIANNKPSINVELGGQVQDILDALGFRSLSGNRILPVGPTGLQIKKEIGTAFKPGANFDTLITQPHSFTLAAQDPITFRYRTQTGDEGLDVSSIDPAIYDLNGVFTAVASTATLATIQQIYIFQEGDIRIQPGQTVHPSLTEAITSLNSAAFQTEENIANNGLYLGSLALKRSATDLTSEIEAIFIPSQGTTTNGSVTAPPLGYTPEDEANKQDSLAVDGTGLKYPTVDAINAGTATAAQGTLADNSVQKTGETTQSIAGDIVVANNVIGQSFISPLVTIVENTLLTIANSDVIIDALSVPVTATLPAVESVPIGKKYTVIAYDVTNTITLASSNSEQIREQKSDTLTSIVLPVGQKYTVANTGTYWIILNKS